MIKNKIIALTAVGCFLAASFRTSVSAENAYTMTDLRHLRDALLQQATMTAADDINGDGVVNVIDLCLLRACVHSKKWYNRRYEKRISSNKLRK